MELALEKVAESMNYLHPSRYVSGRIVEYDIKEANITMLHKYGKIDNDYYNYLKKLPKINREKDIGLLIRTDSSFFHIIQKGIIEAKKDLLRYNSIKIEDIIRIANDAVFINKSYNLKYTKFENVEFKIKSISSSFLKLHNILIFFRHENDNINIDIKGLSKQSQELHSNYMLTFIANSIYLAERVSVEDSLEFIHDFYENYINLNLSIEYYRELSSNSLYHLKYSDFYISDVQNIDEIDINYNIWIIRELWSIILEKYKSK